VPFEDGLAKRLNLALVGDLEARPFESEVDAADPREEGGDRVGPSLGFRAGELKDLRVGDHGGERSSHRPETDSLAQARRPGTLEAQRDARREGFGIFPLYFGRLSFSGFRFDNRRGTAVVDPPAPFAGSARCLRRPDAPDRWAGSLTAPLLGLGRVPLAGPGFDARMVPQLPNFE